MVELTNYYFLLSKHKAISTTQFKINKLYMTNTIYQNHVKVKKTHTHTWKCEYVMYVKVEKWTHMKETTEVRE